VFKSSLSTAMVVSILYINLQAPSTSCSDTTLPASAPHCAFDGDVPQYLTSDHSPPKVLDSTFVVRGIVPDDDDGAEGKARCGCPSRPSTRI
jgi:hypothetical protein